MFLVSSSDSEVCMALCGVLNGTAVCVAQQSVSVPDKTGIMVLNVYFVKPQGHDESVTAPDRPRLKTDANCSFHIIS